MPVSFHIISPLINPANNYEVVVLYPGNYLAFNRWLKKNPWIKSAQVSQREAYRLLQINGGVGVGCMTSDPQMLLGSREIAWIAKTKMKALARLAKGLMVQPLEIVINPSIVNKKEVKEVLTIKLS